MTQPSLEEPPDTTVLWSIYESLKEELTRLKNLFLKNSIDATDRRIEFLSKYLDSSNRYFGPRITEAFKSLGKIESAIKPGPKHNLAEAWKLCVELRAEVVALSSELLALIGGALLQTIKLDSIKEQPDNAPKTPVERGPSFADLSTELVKQLEDHSNIILRPFLIVGEEYLGAGKVELARLQFPQCSIWHVPLTAHQYGYLVATKENYAPDNIKATKASIERFVSSAYSDEPGEFSRQPDATCLLKELEYEWEAYRRKLPGEERKKYRDTQGPRLAALKDQQIRYFYHLFADAFATFYVGPAYICALLFLRFFPEQLAPASPYTPPFTDRFVFALETLRWMQQQVTNSSGEDTAFQLLLPQKPDAATGLYERWRKTVISAGQSDTYGERCEAYSSWLATIKQYFADLPADHLERSYTNWQNAIKLKDKLLTDLNNGEFPFEILSLPLTARDKVVLLNAAWAARWEHPDCSSLSIVTTNVECLLDPDSALCKSTAGSRKKAQRSTGGGAKRMGPDDAAAMSGQNFAEFARQNDQFG